MTSTMISSVGPMFGTVNPLRREEPRVVLRSLAEGRSRAKARETPPPHQFPPPRADLRRNGTLRKQPTMSHPNHNGQYVRRVVLPSGRAIEVVYYESMDSPAPLPAQPLDDLHACPECDRELVYPVEWEESSATHWEVMLRCPNCE